MKTCCNPIYKLREHEYLLQSNVQFKGTWSLVAIENKDSGSMQTCCILIYRLREHEDLIQYTDWGNKNLLKSNIQIEGRRRLAAFQYIDWVHMKTSCNPIIDWGIMKTTYNLIIDWGNMETSSNPIYRLGEQKDFLQFNI